MPGGTDVVVEARGTGSAPVAGLSRTNALRAAGLIAGLVLLAVTVGISLAVGSKAIPLDTVWDALSSYDGTNNHSIIRDQRLPRTVLGLAVGVALGVAGAIIQALTRNPLADPGILGVNSGAAFAVIVGVATFGVTSVQGYIWFAFAGAVITTVAVYLIGAGGREATPVRLTLAGVALGALLSGIASGITLLDSETFDRMRLWNAGTLANRGDEVVLTVLPFVAVGLVLALAVVHRLNTVALGDDLARALGTHLGRIRTVVVIAVTLLCGAATAAAGPIGFIGLMVPHVARWVVGPDQRWILPYTMVLAPSLLLVADVVGRLVLWPGELQAGIVTAFVGAPVLIFLVRRQKASSL